MIWISVPIVIVGSLLWFGLAFWVGLTADRRGYSGLLWFAVGVFVSPIASLVLLALVTRRCGPRPSG